jgi:hypothetical protein
VDVLTSVLSHSSGGGGGGVGASESRSSQLTPVRLDDAHNSTVFARENNMEAADTRRESAPYGRACKNCVRAKCRCLVRDAGTCER